MREIVNLIGQKFGSLTAYSSFVKNAKTKWSCICDCGNTTEVYAASLLKGKTKSCGKTGCRIKEIVFDLTDQKFGFLIAKTFENGKWRCECECGTTKLVSSAALRKGNTRSCGCKTLALIAEKIHCLIIWQRLISFIDHISIAPKKENWILI